MKWLILLALVTSCGKHTEPKAVDYRDSDGDQIQNYKETDFDKYVANFEVLGKVSGVLRFNAGRTIEISFNNDHDLSNQTLEMMTSNANRIRQEDYFSEWSWVNFDKKDMTQLNQEQYPVQIELESGSDLPDELLLITGKSSKVLTKCSPLMAVTLSKETISGLADGTAKLVLVKKFKHSKIFNEDSALSIKEKTYRVFYNDGKASKIYYVSKELAFEKFLELMKINDSIPLNEDDFFFNSHSLQKTGWYTREFGEQDKVVMQVNLNLLRENFLKRFTYQKKTISRVNGVSTSHLDLNNKPGATVYLKIRSLSQTVRTFVASDRRYREGGGGGINGDGGGTSCHTYQRSISKEDVKLKELVEIVDQLNHPEIFEPNLNALSSETGVFWEVKASSPVENMRLALNSLPESTYVMTGEYRNSCNNNVRGQRTNTEGKLSLEVESYVEKID